MKEKLIAFLQRILGYERYLWWFTMYKLKNIRTSQAEKEFFHFVSLLDEQDTVLDIGANLGLMAYFLSNKCHEVIGFEPMPTNLRILNKLKSKKKLDNFTILPYAVGNENTEITMVLPEIKGARKQGLSHVYTDKITEFNEGKKVKAKCFKVDDVQEISGKRINAIKLDVENFEYEVLLGARQLLTRDKPIVFCELWDNQNRTDCFKLMKELNYDCAILKDGKLEVITQNHSEFLNFFFTPKLA